MRRTSISILVALLVLTLSCNEINREATPVELVATTCQDITLIDLTDPVCAAETSQCGTEGGLGTITLRAIQKNPSSDNTFLAVNLERMRVTYVRTDGGTLVPAAFTQTIDGFIEVGTTGSTLNNFIIFQQNAFNQAPFAALYPQNGGLDPETGRSTVNMDIIVEIFGETLSGEGVAAETRFPLEFCVNCGGCR